MKQTLYREARETIQLMFIYTWNLDYVLADLSTRSFLSQKKNSSIL